MGTHAFDPWTIDVFGPHPALLASLAQATPGTAPGAGAAGATVGQAAPAGQAGPGAGAAARTSAPPAVMDEAWIVGFLNEHRFDQPADQNAPDDACQFDKAPSTVAAVIKALDATAARLEVPLSASREDVVRDVLAQHRRGRAMGAMTARHYAEGDDIALYLAGLQKQKMVSMLDALEAIRDAKQLDAILELTRANLRDPRLEVAILSVQHHLGTEWQALMDKLSDDADREAITSHVSARMEDGDKGDIAPLTHGGSGYVNANGDDEAWIKGFLAFVNATPDPLGDGTGRTCSFNGIPQPFARAVDQAVEQAGLAGRMVTPEQVGNQLIKLVVAPPKRDLSGRTAPQYSISYTFLPAGMHVDTKTGDLKVDKPQSQASFTGTIALHPDGAAGPELAWTVQVAVTARTLELQNILQGPQLAWVWPFLKGALQIQVIVTALRGLANTGADAKGHVTMTPSTQVGAAGQVTYAILGNTVLVGFQFATSLTATDGQNKTVDIVPQAFLQVQWQ